MNTITRPVGQQADPHHDFMVRVRRELHQRPELAFQEIETAQIIMRELDALNIPYQYKGQGHGVIGLLNYNEHAPRIALRAELDGLPGEENTGLEFSSLHLGKMHACGHDAHMAIVLGAAAKLQAAPPNINVNLIFQPAEESGGGSKTMIADGALNGVSAIFGGHVTHHYDVGEIMVNDGIITAQSDRFKIHIKGKGGHGARPHEAIDAIIIASALINNLQTIVSREIDPLHPSVITVGTLHAGSAANVIAEEAIMEGSIRSTLFESRNKIMTALKRIIEAYESVYDASISLDIEDGYPPVVNTSAETELARQTVCQISDTKGLRVAEYPSMGSEDFSFYLQEVHGCFVRFGARPAHQEYLPLHSSQFDIDENVLEVGARYFDQLVRNAADYYIKPQPGL